MYVLEHNLLKIEVIEVISECVSCIPVISMHLAEFPLVLQFPSVKP